MRGGLGGPALSGRARTGGWGDGVLPLVERANAYRGRDDGAAVKVYNCPGRGRPISQVCPDKDPVFPGWSIYSAGINPWGKTDYTANSQGILGRGRNMALTPILDATSTTLLAGEKPVDPRAY